MMNSSHLCHRKNNKYVVNQKLEHVDDISFREFLVDDAHDNLKSTLYEHIIHVQSNRFLVGFVLLNLSFSVYCFVDHILSLCLFFVHGIVGRPSDYPLLVFNALWRICIWIRILLNLSIILLGFMFTSSLVMYYILYMLLVHNIWKCTWRVQLDC
jgi:hypothetical protein